MLRYQNENSLDIAWILDFACFPEIIGLIYVAISLIEQETKLWLLITMQYADWVIEILLRL
jgi:hypothetical protein